jgi:hypothetical protein
MTNVGRVLSLLGLSLALGVSMAWVPSAALAQGKGKGQGQGQTGKGKEQDKDKAGAQPAGDQPSSDDSDDKAKPLFQGKSGFKSSRQTKDQATLGFNGLDPNGKVDQAMLNAAPTGMDMVNAKSLIAFAPTKAELEKFLAEGSLKAPAPKAAESKDKKDKDKDKKKK